MSINTANLLLTKEQLLPLVLSWQGFSRIPDTIGVSQTYEIPFHLRETGHSGAKVTQQSNFLYTVTWIDLEHEPLCSMCRRPGDHNHPCE